VNCAEFRKSEKWNIVNYYGMYWNGVRQEAGEEVYHEDSGVRTQWNKLSSKAKACLRRTAEDHERWKPNIRSHEKEITLKSGEENEDLCSFQKLQISNLLLSSAH
jgi:hypothetical protein